MGEGQADDLDPLAPEHRANPYPVYRRLRESEPVYPDRRGTWLLTGYHDVKSVLRDPRLRTGREVSSFALTAGAQLSNAQPPTTNTSVRNRMMLLVDPPDHTRLRTLVSQAFTPTMVEGLRCRVQSLVDQLLDDVAPAGSMDLIADFADPLPVLVICEMLGVPPEDWEVFKHWSSAAARLVDAEIDPEGRVRGQEGGLKLFQYFNQLAAERRQSPKHDLISNLVAAEDEGDRLTHQELLAMATLLLMAGHETTTNLIGTGILALLQHPAELDRLRRDASLVPAAVEELLRYVSPFHVTGRVAAEDLVVGGRPVCRGEQVAALIGAANRDPSVFADPERLDVCRKDNPHIAFGAGPHFCLGAALARLEGQVALSTILRRLPDLELATVEPQFREHFVFRGLKELPVRFRPQRPRVGDGEEVAGGTGRP